MIASRIFALRLVALVMVLAPGSALPLGLAAFAGHPLAARMSVAGGSGGRWCAPKRNPGATMDMAGLNRILG